MICLYRSSRSGVLGFCGSAVFEIAVAKHSTKSVHTCHELFRVHISEKILINAACSPVNVFFTLAMLSSPSFPGFLLQNFQMESHLLRSDFLHIDHSTVAEAFQIHGQILFDAYSLTCRCVNLNHNPQHAAISMFSLVASRSIARRLAMADDDKLDIAMLAGTVGRKRRFGFLVSILTYHLLALALLGHHVFQGGEEALVLNGSTHCDAEPRVIQSPEVLATADDVTTFQHLVV